MQHQSNATRLAVHECGCVVEYVRDRLGEYPQEVNGCVENDELFERYLSLPQRERPTASAFVALVKEHRGGEV
jgi:hypothetical protein